MFWSGGCGDFLPSKSPGHESARIISDVRKAETTPEPNIPLPGIYRSPPKIVEQTVGSHLEYKLFYFCRQHTAAELEKIVSEQFASVLFDEKGKSSRVVDFGISSNPATNQLIARCPNRADAESILEFLQEVDIPPIQVKINCLVSEIYADKTLDWETTLEIEDLFGERLTAGASGRKFGEGITELVADGVLPAFPGASLREVARSRMGLKVGYLSTSGKFLAAVDILESQGYLKILMNPTLEVVNGKTAKVSSTQKVPIDKTFLRDISAGGQYIERTEWENVVDSLTVTPHVFQDGSIGLETNILLGSKLTPEGIKQVSIITKKEIDNKENRIRPGESLIIGGLRKSERRDVLRGIPFLKDIPLLGILFSGRDFEERAVETVFILTPTISAGGAPQKEVTADVNKKHDMPGTKDSNDTGFDPFGSKARQNKLERELADAQDARIEAEEEKALARHAVREADDKVERAEAQVQLAKMKADRIAAEAEVKVKAADEAKAVAVKAIADANNVMQNAQKAIAEADAKSKAADKAKVEAEKIATDATKTKEEAQKAKAAAEALAKAAEQAKAEAAAMAKAAVQSKTEADKATADAAKTKAEAEEAKAQAEKAKAEARKIIADAEARALAAAKEEADQPKDEPAKAPTEEDKAGT
jgi:Flp pilus assembly secretin CpaC